MANALYPKWKQALLQGTSTALLNGSGTTGVYALLTDTSVYTYNPAHEFYTSINSILGNDVEITGKTFVDGKFDGNDISFTTAAGLTAGAIIIFVKNAGLGSTWRLVAYIDSGVTGLPLTTDTSTISVFWSANGIFAL